MSKKTHTHRGTCQACGATQAVDNGTGMVAKHGYKVAGFGFFNGTCLGAGQLPAQISVDVSHTIIASLKDMAASNDADAIALAAGELKPVKVFKRTQWGEIERTRKEGSHERVAVEITWAEANEVEREKGLALAISECKNQASRARSHIEFMIKEILPKFGKKLAKVAPKKAPRKFSIGDQVTIKWGDDLKQVTLSYPVHGSFGTGRVSGYRFLIDGLAQKGWVSMHDLRKNNP